MSGTYSAWCILIWLIVQGFSPTNADAFANKMSKHYGIPLRYELHYFGNKWMGATVYNTGTGSCSSQVYLSTRFRDTALGDDDLWKGVLAHEWAHVLQGNGCKNNEREADAIALRKLLEAGELSAFIRYSIFLQERWKWTIQEVYDAGQIGEGSSRAVGTSDSAGNNTGSVRDTPRYRFGFE